MGALKNFFSRLNFWTLAGLLLVFVCLLYTVLSRQNARFDLTRNRVYTLSPKTVEVLKGLGPEPVTVKAFFRGDQPGREELSDFLKMYAFQSGSFRYRFIDPDRNPGEAKKAGVDEYGTVVVERGDRKERFKEVTEEALTNALLKLAEARTRKVVFVQGHGEKSPEDAQEKGYSHLAERLEAENYAVRSVLLSRDSVPSDADLVVIAGPAADYLSDEITMLQQYLDGGGRVLALLDPSENRLTLLENWLDSYGLVLGRSVVIDKLSRLFGADHLIPVVAQYGQHPITEKFNVASFLPVARTVTRSKDAPADLEVSEIAYTSPGSWAEQDWKQIQGGEVSQDEGDAAGPLSLACAVSKANASLRLVVFGDSDFADNAHLYLSGNKDLVLNSVAWLAGEEKLVTIRPKERASTPLVLTGAQQRLIFVVPVFGFPVLALVSGLAVLLYRRKYS
ncbi:MAG: GldG family protein [Candidatus Omnitrophica bacterium]|nr:GldG family protein [Candidatus Omnitrophota bacterium]